MLLLSLYTIVTPTVILLGKSIFKDAPAPFPSSNVFYEFPTVWEYQGYVGNWMVFFFLGFLVLQMFTSEVTYKTMRQNIITGYTKQEYFISKLIVVVALSIYATLLYFVSCIILGAFHTPGFDMSLMLDNNLAILRFFIMSLGYLSFAFLIANVFRSGGLSMFMYFSYGLIIESILKGLHGYFFKHQSMNYYPLNVLEDNMAFPLMRTSNDFMKTQFEFSLVNTYTISMVLGFVYIIIFVGLSYTTFMKKDV